jgi:hypothetical protein
MDRMAVCPRRFRRLVPERKAGRRILKQRIMTKRMMIVPYLPRNIRKSLRLIAFPLKIILNSSFC